MVGGEGRDCGHTLLRHSEPFVTLPCSVMQAWDYRQAQAASELRCLRQSCDSDDGESFLFSGKQYWAMAEPCPRVFGYCPQQHLYSWGGIAPSAPVLPGVESVFTHTLEKNRHPKGRDSPQRLFLSSHFHSHIGK